MARIGGRDVATNDLGLMGGGLLVLISSFLPWYGASFRGFSDSVSGWNSGWAWIPILLCIAVAGVVAAREFGGARLPAAGPVGPALLLLAVAGLATLLILLRWLTLPSSDFPGVDTGPRVGLFLGLIGAIIQTAFAAIAFKASGEALPGGSGGQTGRRY
jgi:hypothetical protein